MFSWLNTHVCSAQLHNTVYIIVSSYSLLTHTHQLWSLLFLRSVWLLLRLHVEWSSKCDRGGLHRWWQIWRGWVGRIYWWCVEESSHPRTTSSSSTLVSLQCTGQAPISPRQPVSSWTSFWLLRTPLTPQRAPHNTRDSPRDIRQLFHSI